MYPTNVKGLLRKPLGPFHRVGKMPSLPMTESPISSTLKMDFIDLSADLTALPTSNAARLLSESPPAGSSSRSGFSSFDPIASAPDLQPAGDRSQDRAENDEQDEDEDEDEEGLRDEGGEGDVEDEEVRKSRSRKAARAREEKLQNDLFLLKKLNSAFALYTDALMATQSTTEVSGCSPLHPPPLRSTSHSI